MSGALDPTTHGTSYVRRYQEVYENKKPGSKRLDPKRIRQIETRAQHNDHRVHHAHPHPPASNPASPAVVVYVR